MQQTFEPSCFYRKQLNHFSLSNRSVELDKHILTCPQCSKALEKNLKSTKLMSEHFEQFKIEEDVKRQLDSELLETFSNLLVDDKSNKLMSRTNLKHNLKINAESFFLNFLGDTQLKLLVVAMVSFVTLYQLFKPI